MQIMPMNELLRLTRIELCGLEARILNDIPEFSESSAERARALTNLRNIRRVLAWHGLAPG